MDYPYYKCIKCETKITETELPISSKQKYPKCPKCGTNENVDIAIGDGNDPVPKTALLQMLQDKREGVI